MGEAVGGLIPSMPVELLIEGDPIYPVVPQSAAPPGRVACRPRKDVNGRWHVRLKDGREFTYRGGTSLIGAQHAVAAAERAAGATG